MFKIAIIGQKGGDGKTTVALGLAVAAAEAKRDVAIIDLDPQANAANWKDRRTADNPAVISAQVSRQKQTIQTAPVHLCQRGGYAEAPTTGKTAQELDPDGKAADELRRLYMFTNEILKMLNGEQHEQEQNGRAAKRA